MHSNISTYRFVLTLSVICAFLLSLTNSMLKEKQLYNIEVDRKKNVLKCAGLNIYRFSNKEIVNKYNISIKEKVLTLDGNEANITISDLKVVENKSTGQLNYLNNDKEFLPLYEYINDGKIENYIFPISGKGLWSTLYGFNALSNDFINVKGITFFKHGETPGLGGEVDNLNFQNQFIDQKIIDEKGNLVSINIVKPGLAKGHHEVDGLSGATITSKGLATFLKNDLSRYKNFFKI